MTLHEYKKTFIDKHSKADWSVYTSPLREDDSYMKIYTFDDGAEMYQLNRPIEELIRVETKVKGIPVVIESYVKLLETECWNTDDAKSVKFYERW